MPKVAEQTIEFQAELTVPNGVRIEELMELPENQKVVEDALSEIVAYPEGDYRHVKKGETVSVEIVLQRKKSNE